MPALNGYGTLRETTDSAGSTSIEDTAAETFVTAGLAKVLKINNICDNDHLEDCGIATELITLTGSKKDLPKTIGELNSIFIEVNSTHPVTGEVYSYSAIDTKAVAFETANGESILLFYNPSCQANMDETGSFYAATKICAHFMYDLNAGKGPNTVNKDIGFITAIYPTDSVVVSPYVYPQNASDSISYEDAARACTNQDPQYRMPNRYELMSMMASKNLLGIVGGGYNTSSLLQHNNQNWAWRLWMNVGAMQPTAKTGTYLLRCVQR